MRLSKIVPVSLFAVLAFAIGAMAGSTVSSFVSPLQETLGGTNQTTYTTGHLLYSSGTNTLSKLGIGATNNVLTVSGGIPSWGTGGVSDTVWYGDGSDSSITWDGTTTILGMVPASNVYTLTRDVYTTSMTVNTGVSIAVSGWKLCGTGTLTNSGTIKANGSNGSAGVGSIGGGVGGGAAENAIGGGSNGGAGGGTNVNGSNGANAAGGGFSWGSAGGRAGNSGSGRTGGTAGTLGAWAEYNGGLRAYPTIVTGWTIHGNTPGGKIPYIMHGGTGGGGGGGGASAGGGGGGGGGGVVLLAFKTITNTSGTISANGGNGGNGGNSSAGVGAGGGGGVVVYVYNTFSGNTPTATAGVKGVSGSTVSSTTATDGFVIAVDNNK